jgi:DNA-binding winged helix-turn-helix (wHTH) protein
MTDFLLGTYTVAPALGSISSSAGSTRVEPKVMAVLLELARRAGQLTTKAELLDAVWARTAVVEAVLTRCICQLRHAFRDDRRSPRFIETIPKRGYRLVVAPSPVRRSGASAVERSIAVLPFREHGAAADLAGAAGDLLTADLGRYPSLRVLSRTTMARHLVRPTDLPELARALGAELLVEGSVLAGADGSVLLLAQLIDGATDRSLWSGQRLGRPGADPLALRDATQGLAGEIALRLSIGPAEGAGTPRRLRAVAS